MRCSGGHNCNCTNFRRRKSSARCKNCFHDADNHISSSNDDSSEGAGSDDGDDGHTGKLPLNTRNKQTVTSLISDLLDGGEYTGGQFEHARNEARAGLMKRHVGHPTRSRSTIQTHHTMTQHQMKPMPRQSSGTKPSKGNLPDIKSPARVLKIIMFPYGKKVSIPQQLAGVCADSFQNALSAKYPYLTALEPMERQGLVAFSKKGITFCKEWDAKQMCLFFQNNLPRPFQYFSELQGFNQQEISSSGEGTERLVWILHILVGANLEMGVTSLIRRILRACN